MMFVVRDEGVFTERKSRLAGIPEGEGYMSSFCVVDFDFKQNIFACG